MTTTTDTPAVTGEIVPYIRTEVEEYRPRIVMAPEEAKALDDQLRANMKAVLHEGGDYGPIPGAGDKPVLKKPGAEKLLQWFGFGHAMERAEIDTDKDGSRLGVTYRCTVTKGLPDGRVVVVAMCEGYAGYDEDRFYVSAERAREKAEQRERFNAEKYKRQVNPKKWENATEYRAPWNTVIKMSQKRAMVGAALQATSASSLFTQDLEDEVPAAAQPAVLAAAGRTAIGRLPQAVRNGLIAWYNALNWPGPDEWDAEQWCTALVKAGKLTEAHSRAAAPPAQAASPAPAANGNGQHPAPAPEGDGGWTSADLVADYTAKAASFPTEDKGRDLWRDVAASAHARDITREDARLLQDVIQARIADLRAAAADRAVEGVVVPDPTPARTAGTQDAGSASTGTDERGGLNPEDDWAAKVETITGPDDAEAARADLGQQVKSGRMSDARALAISAEIDKRLNALRRQNAGAAA